MSVSHRVGQLVSKGVWILGVITVPDKVSIGKTKYTTIKNSLNTSEWSSCCLLWEFGNFMLKSTSWSFLLVCRTQDSPFNRLWGSVSHNNDVINGSMTVTY